jgi:hypothetical protein
MTALFGGLALICGRGCPARSRGPCLRELPAGVTRYTTGRYYEAEVLPPFDPRTLTAEGQA